MKPTADLNCLHIEDSAFVSKYEFDAVLDWCRKEFPNCKIWEERTRKSMIREWAVHNLLYRLGMFRSHTKDVDINTPLSWYVLLAYNVFGSISLLFIK